MIPYVISVSYPDYKRPCLCQDFGVVKEEEIQYYFLDKVCEFILDRINNNNLNCCQDIENFFNNYYDEYYMDNLPWEAMIFRNGEWENVNPSFELIWEHIQLIKIGKDSSEFKGEEVNETINEDDKKILIKIREYFEELLKEKPLSDTIIESLKNMDEIQQLSALFSIYMTPENYSKNKNLFKEFLNLCLKFIDAHIKDITDKMETNHDEELSTKLKYALEVYSNSLLVKEAYNF